MRVPGVVLPEGLVVVGRAPQGRAEPQAWFGRERQGQHAATTLTAAIRYPIVWASQGRVLTAEEIDRCYQICAEVRSSINSIARRVSTWDYEVVVGLDPSDDGYEAAAAEARRIIEFVKRPNTDRETWQTVITKFVIDLLKYDAAAIEKVRDGNGDLVELVALRGSDIRPRVDDVGHLVRYDQDAGIGSADSGDASARPTFEPDDLIFLRLFPTTSGPEGLPLIECIVTEVIATIRSADHVAKSVDADEIAPGILAVMGLSGQALDNFVAQQRQDKGKDHKLRVVALPPSPGAGVQWHELRHTPKDLSMLEVVDQVRRTIWRVFGVMPIEQGAADGSPRASTETQVDVSKSHLLWPILEAVEQAIDMHVISELVEPETAANLTFRFRRDRDLSAAERESLAKAHEVEFRNGALTLNEWRKTMRRLPVRGGDVAVILTPSGPVRVDTLLDAPETEPEDDTAETGGDDAVEEPEADAAEPDDPDDRGRRRGAHRHAAFHRYGHAIRSRLDVPDAWQPAGRFRGRRVLKLHLLGDAVADYATDALAWWDDAMRAVVAAVESATRDGKITADEVAHLSSRLGSELDTLGSKWSTGSERHYRTAARIGRDAAADYTHSASVPEPEHWSDPYHRRQIGYLLDPDGPVAEVRARVTRAITDSALLRSEQVRDALQDTVTARIAQTIQAARAAFETQRHRVATYAGRLIELANDAFADGLVAGGVPRGPDDTDRASPDWWYAWEGVGDAAQCPTCSTEQARGFQPLRSLRRRPGGDTECRSNCRCVLVVWTEAEVRDGTAERLGS